MKLVRVVLWGLVLVLSAAVAGVFVGRTLFPSHSVFATDYGATLGRSGYESAGGPFTMVNTDGETVTEADLAGKPVAMFFGFTHCPDICPTHLLDASGWLDALGEDSDEIRVVFVSVDPERDTPAVLGSYLSAFDERITGLTTDDPDQLAAMAENYRARYEAIPLQNGDYTMSHSTDTLLFDAEGEYAGYIPYMPPNVRNNAKLEEQGTERTLAQLRELIAS